MGEKVKEKVEGTVSEGWCKRGTYWQWMNPTTGESAKLIVQGVVSHKGKRLCKAVLESAGAEGAGKMESYFDESGSYSHMLLYDERGKLMFEWEMEDGKITMRQYDEQGNVVSEYTMGEGMPMIPGIPTQ
ncbi:hypothetical protein [Candidatus Pyrohabitans sp.]